MTFLVSGTKSTHGFCPWFVFGFEEADVLQPTPTTSLGKLQIWGRTIELHDCMMYSLYRLVQFTMFLRV